VKKLEESLNKKLIRLEEEILQKKWLAVAFSGGVDSTLLLKISHNVLGKNVIGIYADSPLQAARERKEALMIARQIGVELIVFSINKLDSDAFRSNPENRCYLCKGLIFDEIIAIARTKGIDSVADGSNHDDLADFRPGVRALRERGVISPLQDAGLTKQEIRDLSKFYKLPTWDKDALACLATRIPIGEEINENKLLMIDRAEEFLAQKGFRNVRARHMGHFVKIEVRADQVQLLISNPLSDEVKSEMTKLGFGMVIIDREGYSQGKMNRLNT
jgi:pyridinium-3,5-biscarboxylic acid mononucleotide sulfurtransferase